MYTSLYPNESLYNKHFKVFLINLYLKYENRIYKLNKCKS